jgi:sarcosine oxidase
MKPEIYDVIVAGVGSMGAAACYELARSGANVLGLDSQNVPNTNASYHGETRAIRMSYLEHPDYVPLLRDAYDSWHELERDTGVKLLHQTGILYLGSPECRAIRGVKLASEQHGLNCDSLTWEEARREYPPFNLPEWMVGLLEEAGGYVMSDQAVATYVEGAMRKGARIRSHEPVTDWKSTGRDVSVTTPLGRYQAGQLILTAGAWSRELLRLPDVELKVTRQILGWVWPRRPELFARGVFPVWNIDPSREGENAGVYYGFPLGDFGREGVGLKSAWHFPGEPTEPDQVSMRITEQDREEILAPLRRYLPEAEGELLAVKVCRYTNSADGHFIIDRHPEAENVHVACGFSGHGFKFASVMGKVLSELAREGRTSRPIGFLGLGRFGNSTAGVGA